MAKVENNIVTTGLSGKLGNIVFRKRGDKTMVYVLSENKTPASAQQKDARKKFGRCVAKAKAALADESEKERFSQLAEKMGKASAYSAAIAYFMQEGMEVKK